jgi:hypothetical protein
VVAAGCPSEALAWNQLSHLGGECHQRGQEKEELTCPPNIDPSLGINDHRVGAHGGDLHDIAVFHALHHSGDGAMDLRVSMPQLPMVSFPKAQDESTLGRVVRSETGEGWSTLVHLLQNYIRCEEWCVFLEHRRGR